MISHIGRVLLIISCCICICFQHFQRNYPPGIDETMPLLSCHYLPAHYGRHKGRAHYGSVQFYQQRMVPNPMELARAVISDARSAMLSRSQPLQLTNNFECLQPPAFAVRIADGNLLIQMIIMCKLIDIKRLLIHQNEAVKIYFNLLGA